MIRKNKRGFLLAETTVKIVIALIVLGFLIYLLTSLYFSRIRSENQEKAEAILYSGTDTIKASIDSLKEGDSNDFLLWSPSGWYLFSFTGDLVRPAKCEKQNCLCICENVWDIWDRQSTYCHDSGACLILPELIDYEEQLEVYIGPSNVTSITISKIQNKIEIR